MGWLTKPWPIFSFLNYLNTPALYSLFIFYVYTLYLGAFLNAFPPSDLGSVKPSRAFINASSAFLYANAAFIYASSAFINASSQLLSRFGFCKSGQTTHLISRFRLPVF
jgi:hypothetical protein